MKRLLLIALTTLSIHAIAQTNTFPSSGNVGIGTTTPTSKLEIFNTAQEGQLILSTNDNPSADESRIDLDYKIANTNQTIGRISSAYLNSANGGSGALRLYTSNDGVLGEKMKIDNNGNVGIGIGSPQYKLDVAGDTRISGSLLLGNWQLNTSSWPGAGGFTFVGNDVTFGISSTVGQASLQIDGAFIQAEADKTNTYAGASQFNNTVNFPGSGIWNTSGNVGIGTQNPTYKLDVLGTIRAKEVLVNLDGGADFVFEKGYKLLPIEHVANYVQENKHLPGIPSANEMVKNGVSMGDMQVKLLQKVEELTLYAIQQNKEIVEQRKDKKTLEEKLARQENQYNALLEKVELLTKQMEKK